MMFVLLMHGIVKPAHISVIIPEPQLQLAVDMELLFRNLPVNGAAAMKRHHMLNARLRMLPLMLVMAGGVAFIN